MGELTLEKKKANTLGNQIQATVLVQGVRPLLWHHFGPDAIPLQKQEKQGVAGNNPQEWQSTVCMTATRQLFVPNTYLFGCLRDAAPYTKRGKRFQLEITSTLQILDDPVLITNRFVPASPSHVQEGQQPIELPEVYVYVAGVRNPSTGARNIRYRIACAPGWQCSFRLQWDKTVVPRELMQSLCLDAGRMVGLGDGRCIGFGRFEVLAFEL